MLALAPLSPRETEVEELLLAGRTVKETAAEMGISYRTAEAHRASVYWKRGVKSRAELVRSCVARGEEWRLNDGRITTMLGLA